MGVSMKKDLRTLIPPSDNDLNRFELYLTNPKPLTSKQEFFFANHLKIVNAKKTLELFQSGKQEPASLASLVDCICKSSSETIVSISKTLKIPVTLWNKVLKNKIEPFRIPAERLAELAQRFSLPVSTLHSAIQGSYKLYCGNSPEFHVQFTHSQKNSRKQNDYSSNLKAAFDELHEKASKERLSQKENEELTLYMREIQKCLTQKSY